MATRAWGERSVKQDLVGKYVLYKGIICRPVKNTKFKVGDYVDPDKVPSTNMVDLYSYQTKHSEFWIRTDDSYPVKIQSEVAEIKKFLTRAKVYFGKKINHKNPQAKELKEILNYITELLLNIGDCGDYKTYSKTKSYLTVDEKITESGVCAHDFTTIAFVLTLKKMKELTKSIYDLPGMSDQIELLDLVQPNSAKHHMKAILANYVGCENLKKTKVEDVFKRVYSLLSSAIKIAEKHRKVIIIP